MNEKTMGIPELYIPKPRFELPETMAPGIADTKIGQRVRLMVSYQVVEKTKSYCVLKINSVFLTPSKRTY